MERGLNADAERICVVRGDQMGIYLAGRALLRPGDAVALDALSYPPAREAFRSWARGRWTWSRTRPACGRTRWSGCV